jgi:Skp family chaperone for outer membrane proteins
MSPISIRKCVQHFCMLLLLPFFISSQAQRGAKIGFVDTEFILENVPEYQEAMTQLDEKVKAWRTEIEQRFADIESRQDLLNNERVLLTERLIEERQADIDADRNELIAFQQKRFGPKGDYLLQKQLLMRPIQDQIFNAVQDIVSSRKYDFVFDKSADVVMLYANDQYDLSEVVLRTITRTSERKQIGDRKDKKDLEDEQFIEEEEAQQQEVEESSTPSSDLDDRKKAIEEERAARAKAAADKRLKVQQERDERKKAYEEKRRKLLEKREADKKAREEAKKKKDN